jgi:hypothetical protein
VFAHQIDLKSTDNASRVARKRDTAAFGGRGRIAIVMVKRLFYVPVILASLAMLWSPVQLRAQAAKTYKTRLAPVPVPTFNPAIVGSGSVTATVTGTKLSVTGTFEGLSTSATEARIHKSPKTGIRGPVLFELTVSKGTSGTINGAIDLSAAQVEELAQGRYYVQLHSEKAPDGNLWGWLQEARQ